MFKKSIVLLLSLTLVFSLVSCGGANNSFKQLKEDLQAFSDTAHAKVTFVSIFKKGDKSQKQTTTLSYQFNDQDEFLYSLAQYDSKDNIVYYEFNDGTTYEEWLLGKGATTSTSTDKNFTMYTKSNPHKYFSILSAISDDSYVKKCKLDDETNKIYTIDYDNKKLNKKLYSDENYKLENKKNTVSFNDKSELTNILEEVSLIDNDKNVYGACILDINIEYSKVAPTLKRPMLS